MLLKDLCKINAKILFGQKEMFIEFIQLHTQNGIRCEPTCVTLD